MLADVQTANHHVAEIWWNAYHDALDRLDVVADDTVEGVLIESGCHPQAKRLADALAKRIVEPEAWRSYRNELRQPPRKAARQRQVARPPKRGMMQANKRRVAAFTPDRA